MQEPQLTPTLRRGMGHVPGPYPATALSTKHLFGARRIGATNGVDLSDYVDQIRDQKQTSRCVGAARARVIHMRAQIEKFGRPNPGAVPYPSERAIYALAREEAAETADDELVDQGSIPALADQALSRDIGVPLERDFPEDDAAINDRVPADVLARAMSMKMSAYYLIDSDGSHRVDDAIQALENGYPFTIAIPVGDEYEGANSDKPVVAAQGRIYGGHCIAIVGYRIVASRRQFKNPGSWGVGFGFGGYVWLDESVLLDPRASDFVVPTVVPDFAGGR